MPGTSVQGHASHGRTGKATLDMEAPDDILRLDQMVLLASSTGSVPERAGEHGFKLGLRRSQSLATGE